MLDFLLNDALFFFLLALRVFCEGSGGVGDKMVGAGVAGRPWGSGFPGAGGTHLGPAGPEDPGRGDDHSGVDPQGARLLDLLQHEAGHLSTHTCCDRGFHLESLLKHRFLDRLLRDADAVYLK